MVRVHGNYVNVRMRYIPAGDDQPNFLWLQLNMYDFRQAFHRRIGALYEAVVLPNNI